MPEVLLATALSVTCPVDRCRARRGDRCVINRADKPVHWQRYRAGLEKEFPDPDNNHNERRHPHDHPNH